MLLLQFFFHFKNAHLPWIGSILPIFFIGNKQESKEASLHQDTRLPIPKVSSTTQSNLQSQILRRWEIPHGSFPTECVTSLWVQMDEAEPLPSGMWGIPDPKSTAQNTWVRNLSQVTSATWAVEGRRGLRGVFQLVLSKIRIYLAFLIHPSTLQHKTQIASALRYVR